MAELSMAAWDGSPSRFKDTAAYCAACLVDLNAPGQAKTQANCKLPIREPDGRVNVTAMHAAAAALLGARGGVQAPADAKRSAARALVRHYADANQTPPDALRRMAGL